MTQRTIPFFDYPHLYAENKKEIMGVVENVLSRGAFIMQKDVFDFEEGLANFLRVKHAVGLADGTMAMMIGLMASGFGPGEEVLVSSHTFVASAAAIHHVGAKPVLVDCGDDHLMDPKDAESRITEKTTGIMPVHLNGRTCDMGAISKLAKKYKLKIVEDACQALGSTFEGKFAGTFGSFGAFSFYPSKTLGCFGDGGALVTNDDKVAAMARTLRDHGRSEAGDVVAFGFNSRLDNLQAAVLNFRLRNYRHDIRKRRELAGIYQEHLGDLPQLVLPPGPDESDAHFDIYQNYEIEAERRDELKEFLLLRGVGTILQWGGKAIHQFEALGFTEKLRKTDEIGKAWMMLPMNTSLSDKDVEYVSECVKEFYHG